MSPTTSVFGPISDDALSTLSENSRACIERLCRHEPPDRFELGTSNEYVSTTNVLAGRRAATLCANLIYSSFSHVLAAVLVLLYERAGGLRVLLTTRSKELRSHPGQTALPGGKVDQSDAGVVETAVRLPPLPL
jgi:hypothetical protein